MRDYKVKNVAVLSRAFEVLRVLQEMRAASLHDLHLATGIPKSSLLRILATAHQAGLVWQRMVDGAFVPSYTLQPRVEVDNADWLVEIASPVMEQLTKRVLWPSVLSVPRLDHVETLESNSSKAYFHELPANPRGFRVNMLRSASGRAYLAYLPTSGTAGSPKAPASPQGARPRDRQRPQCDSAARRVHPPAGVRHSHLRLRGRLRAGPARLGRRAELHRCADPSRGACPGLHEPDLATRRRSAPRDRTVVPV